MPTSSATSPTSWRIMERLSAEHCKEYGVALGLDHAQLGRWLFRTLGLPVLKHGRRGTQWVPSLDAEALSRLEAFNEDPRVAGSLRLIRDYRKAAGLLVRLRSLLNHIDPRTGRIHSSFDDRQATGRLSSTYPNLQQLAKKKEVRRREDPQSQCPGRLARLRAGGLRHRPGRHPGPGQRRRELPSLSQEAPGQPAKAAAGPAGPDDPKAVPGAG